MSDNKIVVYKQLDKIMKDNLYPSTQVLYEIAKRENSDVTMKQIKEYVESQKVYQLTKERKITKQQMGHVVSYKPWSIVQIDLLDMQKYSYDYTQFKSLKKLEEVKTDFNKGYKYIMILIDVFSRYVDAVMLKSKNIDDCINSLKIMIDFNKINPTIIMSDSESSFMSKPFQKFLEERSIIHDPVVLNNHRALSVVDRFCRTLRSRLIKLFLGNGNTGWIDHLSTIIQQYNNTSNRGILNFTPQQVLSNPKIQEIILELNNEKSSKNQQLKSKSLFKSGDHVRIYNDDNFKKGPKYSSDVYVIKSVIGKNITLSNGKRVIDSDLLKVNVGNLMLTNDGEISEINPIEIASKETKIAKKLKNEGIERPKFEILNEPRSSRNIEKVDYKKLSTGK